MGCRHTHGLDIVWSARHGATSELEQLPAALTTSVSSPEGPTAPRSRSDASEASRGQVRMRRLAPGESGSERDALVRLVWLRVILGFGAAVILGSGAALAALQAGVAAAVACVAVMLAITGWLAVRGTPASTVFTCRLDRVRPASRAVRTPHSLLSTLRASAGS